MTPTIRILAACTIALFTAGCASVPPPKTCAMIGAGLGGAGGAVGGAKNDRKHDGDSIMGYGALGIVVGGGLGYLACSVLHEEEEAEVAVTDAGAAPAIAQTEPPAAPAQAPTTAAEVAPDPCEQQFSLPGVHFEFDKSAIRPEGAAILNDVATRLAECPAVQVRVVGHTDAIGTDAYNQGLSERRAQSVLAYLIGRNLQSTRFSASGQGEGSPVADNGTSEGRALNRRVELHPSR